MRSVRFLRACPPYNAGEVAGFGDAEAARLVARGTAAFHVEPGADAGTGSGAAGATEAAPSEVATAEVAAAAEGEAAATDHVEPGAEAGAGSERRRRSR